MTVVVDASWAVKWFVPEEGAARADRLLTAGQRLLAPELMLVEVANVLTTKARRGEAKATLRSDAAFWLDAYGIGFVDDRSLLMRGLIIFGERAPQHPVYDLLYLSLAHRENASIATFDRRLGELAGRIGIRLWTDA